MSGPLAGLTIVEVASIGPGPFCAMMLADMGATVIRVDRASSVDRIEDPTPSADVLNRGRRSIGIDLKQSRGVGVLLDLVERADGLIEGFRPGVAERLGFGPDVVAERNPKLVYGRVTGWGQDGPRAPYAGHDIDYIALSGVLGSMGPPDRAPLPPLNLAGDFGGGGLLLAFGMMCAVFEAQQSGLGQVVDSSMVDGSALLMTMMYALKHMGVWDRPRGENLLDGGAPFYAAYRTKDDRFVAVGAIEEQFFAALIAGLGVSSDRLGPQSDRERWPEMRALFAEIFLTRTQAQWLEVFDGTDACVAPVHTMESAASDPHNVARATFVEVEGLLQPASAPRFSRTPAPDLGPAHQPGSHTDRILMDLGWQTDEIADLRAEGVVR